MTRRIALLVPILAALLISSCAPAAGQTTPRHDSPQPDSSSPEVSFAPLQPGAFVRFHKISIEEGLSQSVVYDMAQDASGFLWLGTQDGLNRYDGYHFSLYKPNPQDPNSISDGWVTSLLADADGSIWAGTNQGGLNHYDPQTGKFTRYQHNEEDDQSLTEGTVLAF